MSDPMPHQIRLLQTKVQRAEQDAMDYAAQADYHANRLAIVMNELMKHDKEFVDNMLKPPAPPEPPQAPAPANDPVTGVPESPAA